MLCPGWSSLDAAKATATPRIARLSPGCHLIEGWLRHANARSLSGVTGEVTAAWQIGVEARTDAGGVSHAAGRFSRSCSTSARFGV